MDEISKLKLDLKELNAEYAKIKDVPVEKRSEFGRELNEKKARILEKMRLAEEKMFDAEVVPLDITAPCAANEKLPEVYPVFQGSAHPLMTEIDRVTNLGS